MCFAWKKSSVKDIKTENSDCHVTTEEEFIIVSGQFNDGDKILLEINSPIHRVLLGKEKNVYAFMYGPVLLAKVQGDYEDDELTKGEKDCFGSKNSKFIPLYKVENETYTVYMNSIDTKAAKDGSSSYED